MLGKMHNSCDRSRALYFPSPRSGPFIPMTLFSSARAKIGSRKFLVRTIILRSCATVPPASPFACAHNKTSALKPSCPNAATQTLKTTMRRSILGARPVRSLAQAFGSQQPRRAFATPPTKDTSPPSPIERSQTQAHPIGPFYEAILNSAQPIPDKKPEVPPVTSKTSPPSPPIAPAPEAAPAAPTPAKRGRPAKPKAENGKAKLVTPPLPPSVMP